MLNKDQIILKMSELQTESEAIINNGENRDMTNGELARLDQINGEFQSWEKKLQTVNNSEKLGRSKGRVSRPYGAVAVTDKPVIDYFQSVARKAQAERQGGPVDQRTEKTLAIFNAPSQWGSESIPAEGGFAVPQDFRE